MVECPCEPGRKVYRENWFVGNGGVKNGRKALIPARTQTGTQFRLGLSSIAGKLW